VQRGSDDRDDESLSRRGDALRDRRKAFGRVIRKFQGVSFMIARAQTLLDASRAMVYQAARAADEEVRRCAGSSPNEEVRHRVSLGGREPRDAGRRGIGYTDVYPSSAR